MEINKKPTTTSHILSIFVVLFSFVIFAIAYGTTYSNHGGSGKNGLGCGPSSLRQIYCKDLTDEECNTPLITVSCALQFGNKPWIIIATLITIYLTILLYISRTGKWLYLRSFLLLLGNTTLLALLWVHNRTPIQHNICTGFSVGSILLLMILNMLIFYKNFKTWGNILYGICISLYVIFLIVFLSEDPTYFSDPEQRPEKPHVFLVGGWEVGMLLSYILSNLVIGFATSKKK